jgi:hypothetical protein
VQMIDTSVVRVHQHGVCIAENNQQGSLTRWSHQQEYCLDAPESASLENALKRRALPEPGKH